MVCLSTKRRGVAVVAVLTLGLLFGIALLMMQHALPMSETNFSSSGTTTVSMTLHTQSTTFAGTTDDFNFVNTANSKVVSLYKVSQPGRDAGRSKTFNLALNEELGDLFCLCTTGNDIWEGQLSDFKVNDVSFPGVATTLKLSIDDDGYYPCWRFGIDSNDLAEKGYSQDCSLSNTVSMTLRTLNETNSNTDNDLKFLNWVNDEVVVQYKISEPGRVEGQSTTVNLNLREELGDLFCLCATGDDAWKGEISDFTMDGASLPGLVTSLKLSTDDIESGGYPCWRFAVESDELVDKGHSWQCSLSTKAWIKLYTKPNTNAGTGDDFMFVSTDDVTVLEQYELTQPGSVEGESTVTGVALNGDLGDTFCLCATGDNAWDGEIQQMTVYGVTFVGAVDLKLSTDDSGYYPCWRLGIDEESKMLVDKGHSDSCI